tara:strand:- start:276 stop:971 length:696 start_codon:yes stop_codon:yes gene_type:complete
MKKNIFVALDIEFDDALALANNLKPLVYGLKIGSVLYNKIGQEGLKKFDNLNVPIFLDLKFHEIPSIVKKNIYLFKQYKNIKFLTVHSLSSQEMIEGAVAAAKEINKELNVMAVTILTSSKPDDLKKIGIENNIEEQVKHLVKFSKQCGVQGVISSGQNLKLIRELTGPQFKIICPGIRSEKDHGKDDQSATMSYSEFNKLANENTYCVIGRPIYQSGNPIDNLKKIISSS